MNNYIKLRKKLSSEFVKCENCDIMKATQVHHINKDRKNNKRENLTVLCRRCHVSKHFKNVKIPKSKKKTVKIAMTIDEDIYEKFRTYCLSINSNIRKEVSRLMVEAIQ